jgi:hypothetical protein
MPRYVTNLLTNNINSVLYTYESAVEEYNCVNKTNIIHLRETTPIIGIIKFNNNIITSTRAKLIHEYDHNYDRIRTVTYRKEVKFLGVFESYIVCFCYLSGILILTPEERGKWQYRTKR